MNVHGLKSAAIGLAVAFALFNASAKTTTLRSPGKWSTATSWSDGIPASGDEVVLTADSENDLSGLSLSSLVYAGTGGYRLAGNALALTGSLRTETEPGGNAALVRTFTNDVALTLSGAQTWSVGSNGTTVVFSKGIAATGLLTCGGFGHLEFRAANDLRGGFTAASCEVHAFHPTSSFSSDGAGTLTFGRNAAGVRLWLHGVAIANPLKIWDNSNHRLVVVSCAGTTNTLSGQVTLSGTSYPGVMENSTLIFTGGVKGSSSALFRPITGLTSVGDGKVTAGSGENSLVVIRDLPVLACRGLGYEEACDIRFEVAGNVFDNNNQGESSQYGGLSIRTRTLTTTVRYAFDCKSAFGPVRAMTGTFDLSGNDQRVSGFANIDTKKQGTIRSDAPATLYLVQHLQQNTPLTAAIDGALTISKAGTNVTTIAGEKLTTGALEVTEGDLVLAATARWPNVTRVTVAGTNAVPSAGTTVRPGNLCLSSDGNLPLTATIDVLGNGRVTVADGMTVSVGGLRFAGVRQAAGKYGSSAAKAIDAEVIADDVHFAGTGILLVTGSATAERCVWTGAAGTGLFSDPSNWQGGVAPIPGDAVVLSGTGEIRNDLPGTYVKTLEFAGTGPLRLSGGPLSVTESVKVVAPGGFACAVPLSFTGKASFEIAAGGALTHEGGFGSVGEKKLAVAGPGALTLDVPADCGFRRVLLSDGATLAFLATPAEGFRTPVIDMADDARLSLAAGTKVDAFSVFTNAVPVAKGIYTGSGAEGTPIACVSGEGVLVAATAPAKLDRRTRTVLKSMKRFASEGKWLVSWRSLWAEDEASFRYVDAKGEWKDKEPDEVDLDATSSAYQKGGVHPYMYFLDFYQIAGTWYGKEHYAQCRATFRAMIRAAYKRWHSIPVFSWHFENPYVPTGWSDPSYGGSPFRYRYSSEGYPQEHRYLSREVLENTGAACGLGRVATAKTEVGTASPNPRAWFEEHLDVIGDFLDSLRDEDGQRIPVIIRWLHECEDDWACWGRGSVSVSDYRRMFRYLTESIRWRTGGTSELFGYGPDRYCSSGMGEEGDTGTYLFMSRYPGDDVVDVIGYDDYSIGTKATEEANLAAFTATTNWMVRITNEAERRGKACGLFETGIKDQPDTAYQWHYRALTSPGVRFSFLNTWGGNTIPTTQAGIDSWKAYLAKPEPLSVPKDRLNLTGYDPGMVILKFR